VVGALRSNCEALEQAKKNHGKDWSLKSVKNVIEHVAEARGRRGKEGPAAFDLSILHLLPRDTQHFVLIPLRAASLPRDVSLPCPETR
jgi:hypothetical protein